MAEDGSKSYKSLTSIQEQTESSRIEMDKLESPGQPNSDVSHPIHAYNDRFVYLNEYYQRRFNKLIKAVAILGCCLVILVITTFVLHFHQRSEYTKGLDSHDAEHLELAKLLNETNGRMERLKNTSAALQFWSEKQQLLSLKVQSNQDMLTQIKKQGNRSCGNADVNITMPDLSVLAAEVSETKEAIHHLLNESGYCPLKYQGKCFWIARHLNPRITFAEGQEICATSDGKAANIYSEKHHHMIMAYLRALRADSSDIYAWVGMTYNTSTGMVHLSDGRIAPFVKWYPGNPRASSCCNIALRPREDWQNEKQDMYTTTPTSTKRAVICEK